MHTHYWNMKSRATNEGMKASHPQYKDTKVCDDWLNNPDSFYQWFIDNLYFYPGELALDKDILGFGEQNIYSPQYASLVPVYVNNAFTCDDSKSGLCYCIKEKHEQTVKSIILFLLLHFALMKKNPKIIFAIPMLKHYKPDVAKEQIT